MALPLAYTRSVFLLLPALLLLHRSAIVIPTTAAAEPVPTALQPMAKPVCLDKCGGVAIPYPFGIGPNCFLNYTFNITCDENFSPPKAFIGTSNIEIINISLSPPEVRTYKYISYNCFNQSGMVVNSSAAAIKLGWEHPYRFSTERNKFTAIGCYTLAYILGHQSSKEFSSGCASFCDSQESATNGSCSGIGCCQTNIPNGVTNYEVEWGFKHNFAQNFSPCSYAMLVEEDWYKFDTSDLLNFDFFEKNNNRTRVVLDWAVRNYNTCSEAKGRPDYACRSENSYCYNSANGVGYLCNCSQGYEGNPYLENGCTDIDECNYPNQYPCYGTCSNTPAGNYSCTCPKGTQGDPKKESCTKIPEKFPYPAKLAVGACVCAIVVVAIWSAVLLKLQKQRYIREKDEYFKQNGGFKLYEEMRSRQVDTIWIFTEKDLEKATNNFDKDRIIGCGGHGMVYKGILEDNREVAIKKSRIVGDDQKEEFVNEIIILSQINHKNVVRLLGCCLDVDVPMLVYEFISNGTLFDLLHGKDGASRISLNTRLKIATESAEALGYLHSSTSRPILHGDVKSLNILLDYNYEVKVSDFGASKLVPMDEAQFVMFVQGTKGYLDPECLYTGKLTEKSDVYSFGVVLVELITRKNAIYIDDSNEKKCLASSFVSMVNQDKLQDFLDDQIQEEGSKEVLQEVAKIALQCLCVKGEERPTMKEVAEELQRLLRFRQHPWEQRNPQETESLLGGESAAPDISQYHSLENRLVLEIESGR